MQKIFQSKFLIVVISFLLGFYFNHFLNKVNNGSYLSTNASDERIPVNPEDFDHQKMMDAASQMERDLYQNAKDSMEDSFSLGEIKRNEDAQFVWYEIPVTGGKSGENHLNVEVKNGMIHISESIKDKNIASQSERSFSIDAGLMEEKAQVENEKDKIIIKIPKRKK